MTDTNRVYEAKIRRWAKKKGLLLQKIKSCNTKDIDHGSYRVLNQKNKDSVFSIGGGYGKTLEEVEEFLNNYRPE